MRRLFGLGFVGLMGVAVVGCPIYEHDYGQCYDSNDCPSGEYCNSYGYCDVYSYYYGVGGSGYAGSAGHVPAKPDAAAADAGTEAGDAVASDAPTAVVCGNPNDCSAAETCGVDGACHAGSCDKIACINQFVCAQSAQGLACVAAKAGACAEDFQCTTGNKCVDGVCTALAELCSDRTQCPAGSVCVTGKCVTSCDTDAQCKAGYRCGALKICNVAAKACTKASECGGPDLVCSGGACVPRCAASGACGDGNYGVCVWNGCVPVQGVVRQCDLDQQCNAGEICVHHRCYVSCDPDGGAPCAGTDVCRTVMTSSTRSVCGSADSLGSDCDPSRGVACTDTSKTCIDGFCK